MKFNRVIPRDLFNEAKLLKCLGQLALLIHDGKTPIDLKFEEMEEDQQFDVEINDNSELYCTNLTLTYKDNPIHIFTPYNSKEPYPLRFTNNEEIEYDLLDEKGKITKEFTEFLNKLDTMTDTE